MTMGLHMNIYELMNIHTIIRGQVTNCLIKLQRNTVFILGQGAAVTL